MKLKCKTNNTEYENIVSGATFSEEFNETLDSGSIILSHVPRIKDLKPYDDVFIYNAEEKFNGYINKGDIVPFEAESSTKLGNILPGAQKEEISIVENNNIFIEEDERNFYISGKVVNIWKYFCFNFNQENASSKCKYDVNLLFDVVFEYNTVDQNGDTVVEMVDFNNFYPGSNVGGKHATLAEDLKLYPNEGSYESIDIYFDNTSGKIVIPRFAFLNNKNGEIISVSISSDANIFKRFQDNTFKIILKTDKIPQPRETIISFLYEGDYINAELTNVSDITETRFTALFASELAFERVYFIKGDNNYYYAGISTGTAESIVVKDADDIKIIKANYLQKEKTSLPSFYKHMLVDNYTEEQLNFDEVPLFKYKINLFSETKKLEKVILPNVSITQSIYSNPRTCLFYLKHFVELYSPKIKKISNTSEKEWEYVPKYSLDLNIDGEEYNEQCIDAIFGDVKCPEMSLTSPSLKDVLSKIMIVKDCIPVVKDDVIYAMQIGETKDIQTNFGEKLGGVFEYNPRNMSFPVYSMNSGDYTNGARREYSGAISQQNSARYIEYLGFRNSSDALMTLENMKIETRFPIYKINKLYLCYYKKATITSETKQTEKSFICKHDITDLILQNSVRNALSADWTKYPKEINSRDDMKKYRILTLGYDIGGKVITGWGTKYSQLEGVFGWFNKETTYLEAILNLLEKTFNTGDSALYLQQQLGMLGKNTFATEEAQFIEIKDWEESMIAPKGVTGVQKLKSVFFEMDYNAMFDGAVYHSKNNVEEDEIVTSDNCSSALSILEVDGLFEKEKMNRIGNKTFNLQGRYSSFEEMQNNNNVLGSVFDDNIVIYHRDYAIYNDYIQASFTGTYDYVMKNYFTTVFAKLRMYNFMSYEESTLRSENIKWYVNLNSDKCYFENNGVNASYLMSAFNKTKTPLFYGDESNHFLINGGYFTGSFWEEDKNKELIKKHGKFYSDFNSFVCGDSLCFNIQMFDNVTNGVYISTFDTTIDESADATGSVQEYYMATDEINDAFIEKIGCYIGHFEKRDYFLELPREYNHEEIENKLKDILALPKAPENESETFSFGSDYSLFKDNKEILNVTFQFEPISYDKDVVFSQWLMRLSDLVTTYTKFDQEIEVYDFSTLANSEEIDYLTIFYSTTSGKTPVIIFQVKKEKEITVGENVLYEFGVATSTEKWWTYLNYMYTFLEINLNKVMEVNEGNVVIKCNVSYLTKLGDTVTYNENFTENIVFKKIGESKDGFVKYRAIITRLGKYSLSGSYQNGKEVATSNNPDFEFNSDNSYIYNGSVSINKYLLLKTYPQTMYIIDSTKPVKNELVYDDLNLENLPNHMRVMTVSNFNNVFSTNYDDSGAPYINIDTSTIVSQRTNNSKSIQYWFKDNDGLLKFVFGTNIDNTATNKKVYISVVQNRSTKVYDAYHNVTSHIVNYLSEEDKEGAMYGEKQKYKENE